MLISEIFNQVEQAKNDKERFAILSKHSGNRALMTLFHMQYNESISSGLPVGAPKYKECDGEKDNFRNLTAVHTTLQNLYNPKISSLKKERMFFDILETIHPTEAKMLIEVKDRNLHTIYKSISKKLVKKVWPTLKI